MILTVSSNAWYLVPLLLHCLVLEPCAYVYPDMYAQGAAANPLWRETTLNHQYQLCETYPNILLVPSFLNDAV